MHLYIHEPKVLVLFLDIFPHCFVSRLLEEDRMFNIDIILVPRKSICINSCFSLFFSFFLIFRPVNKGLSPQCLDSNTTAYTEKSVSYYTCPQTNSDYNKTFNQGKYIAE